MFRTTLMLAVVFGFLTTPVLAQLPTETQSFDAEPDDWAGRLNQVPASNINIGWDDGTGTNFRVENIIGDGGWAGGLVSRSELDESIYADVTIGEFSLDDELHANGTLLWKEFGFNGGIATGFLDMTDIHTPDPDNDGFTLPPDFMGFDILEDRRLRAGYSLDENFADFGIGARGQSKGPVSVQEDVPLEFEIHWDPNDPGGFGEGALNTILRDPVTGDESTIQLFMSFGGRDTETKFNAFGMWVFGPASEPRIDQQAEFFIDDIEYTSNGECGNQEICQEFGIGEPPFVPAAGDANGDKSVDTADIVQILAAAKFETGMAAAFGEGDFDGDGVFATSDIVAMLAAGFFETGPYAALQDPPAGSDEVVVNYDATDGNVSVNASRPITSISLESASGIFTGSDAQNLGGPFDVDTDVKVFKAVFGSDFSEVDFGAVAEAGLAKDLLLNDLTASGSLAGGGGTFGPEVQLNYIPEPSTIMLLGLGLLGLFVCGRHQRQAG